MDSAKHEIAAAAARLVAQEGLAYGAAKRRALQQLGLPARTALPDNELVESELEDYLALFCADTQPGELRVLRTLALHWMRRLERFRPHLGGAVWRGTATRMSDIYLQLFCDDSKIAEITLIDMGVRFDTATVAGLHGEPAEALSVQLPCPELRTHVGLHLLVCDFDDLRGALRPDARGRKPRGDMAMLQKILEGEVQ